MTEKMKLVLADVIIVIAVVLAVMVALIGSTIDALWLRIRYGLKTR